MIPSGDVLELVGEHRLELIGSERSERGGGHEHQRAEPAHDHRCVDDVTDQHRHAGSNADLRLQRVEHLRPLSGGFGDADDPKSSHPDPLSEQANRHEGDPGEPGAGDHHGRRPFETDRLGIDVSGSHQNLPGGSADVGGRSDDGVGLNDGRRGRRRGEEGERKAGGEQQRHQSADDAGVSRPGVGVRVRSKPDEGQATDHRADPEHVKHRQAERLEELVENHAESPSDS